MSNSSNNKKVRQRLIGLTGGIGMGKTTVADYLANTHHLPILDADLYARDAVQPASPILTELVDRYGSGILLPDGTLNRHRLGTIIFQSSAERLWVEQKMHPYVRDRFIQALHTTPLNDPHQTPTVVLVIPLLFEARMTELVTETWVVYCSFEQQLARIVQRDHLSPEEAQMRINSQMAIQRKIDRADVVLQNSTDPNALFEQIDQALALPSSAKILPH
jgi:dephospho-CoA kinase